MSTLTRDAQMRKRPSAWSTRPWTATQGYAPMANASVSTQQPSRSLAGQRTAEIGEAVEQGAIRQRMADIPHPIPYQGSKRGLAPLIGGYVPDDIDVWYEPFAGSARRAAAGLERRTLSVMPALCRHPPPIHRRRMKKGRPRRTALFLPPHRKQTRGLPCIGWGRTSLREARSVPGIVACYSLSASRTRQRDWAPSSPDRAPRPASAPG